MSKDLRITHLEEKFRVATRLDGHSELLDAVLNAVDNTIVVTDPRQDDNPIIYVNTVFEQMTGYSFDEVIGRNCRFLQANDTRQPGLKAMREGLKKQEVTKVLLRNYRKDGSLFWNELFVSPIFDAAGQLIFFVGVQNDVTNRENLFSERTRLTAAVRSISDAIIMTDAPDNPSDAKIIYTNPAFETLTGYTSEEVMGKNPRLLQGLKTDPVVIDRLRKALNRGESFRGETFNYRKDGEVYIVDWQVSPVRLIEDDIAYWVATQRDVTARRALERKALVSASEEQRRIARDLHDGVVQDITAAGMMVSNLLNKIDSADPETIKEDLNGIRANLKEMMRTTRSLAHHMHGQDLTGNGLMTELSSLVSSVTRDHGVTTEFIFETPLFMTDPARAQHVYRVAQEAVTNAVKHGQPQTITLSLAGEGNLFILSVRDDGLGLPTTGALKEGMGFSNMRSRAAQLDGSLTVNQELEGGTQISLTFKA